MKNANKKELPDGKELKKLAPIYLTMWKNLIDYPAQEDALLTLFGKWKDNTNYSKILVKVTTLDKLYSTQLRSVNDMAKRIIETTDFDQRVSKGDITLVDEICRMGDYVPFSFTSKYCSHHNPEAFPIYDSFVAKVLTAYRKRDSFTKIRADISSTKKNKSYEKEFYPVIAEFRDYYNLSKYSFKELDEFLWLLGKVHFGGKVQTLYYKSAQIGNYTIRIDKSGSVTVCVDSVPVSNAMEGMRAASRLLNGFEFKPGWNTQQTGRELVKYAIEYAECLPAEPEI